MEEVHINDQDKLIIEAYKTERSFLAVEGIDRIEKFKAYIKLKRKEFTAKDPTLRGKSVTYIGALCLQVYIKDTLSEYMKRPSKRSLGDDNLLRERLAYFTSQKFIERFMAKIPSRLRKTQSAAATGYANYFNCLFSVNFSDFWRGSIENYSAQRQCTGAMGLRGNPGRIISTIQGRGDKPCYLCGQIMHDGYKRIECEHLLPILSAITNWWLVKTPEVNEMVRTLYEFSHRCCNQVKSNFDFIILDKKGYRVNEFLVEDVLELIYAAGDRKRLLYDCSKVVEEITEKSKLDKDAWLNSRLIEIKKRFQVFVNVLNASLDELNTGDDKDNDVELFSLLTKFKIFSAFNQEDFLKILISDRSGTPPETNRERRQREKKEEQAEKIKLLELEAQMIKEQKLSRSARRKKREQLRLLQLYSNYGSNQIGGTLTDEELGKITPELVVVDELSRDKLRDISPMPYDIEIAAINYIFNDLVPGELAPALHEGLITYETMESVFNKIFLDGEDTQMISSPPSQPQQTTIEQPEAGALPIASQAPAPQLPSLVPPPPAPQLPSLVPPSPSPSPVLPSPRTPTVQPHKPSEIEIDPEVKPMKQDVPQSLGKHGREDDVPSPATSKRQTVHPLKTPTTISISGGRKKTRKKPRKRVQKKTRGKKQIRRVKRRKATKRVKRRKIKRSHKTRRKK